MVFGDFMSWLDSHLASYIAAETVAAATSLGPASSALGAIYVMGWGYLHLSGQVAEPLIDGARRILTLAVVFGASLHLWLYNEVLTALLVDGPQQLAAALVGSPSTVTLIDTIWEKSGECGDVLWSRGGVFSGDAGFYIAGAAVWCVMGLLCLYATFLLALTKIATAVLLAVGPAFILSALFERTRSFFEAWTAQLATYALVAVLVALIAALMLQLVATYAEQTSAKGSALATVDVLDLLLVTGIVLLLLRQVMPIASGLGRGVSLSTFGAGSTALRQLGLAAAGARDTYLSMAYPEEEGGYAEGVPGRELPKAMRGGPNSAP